MVEQSRKDVPDQKASIADPLSFCAIIYKHGSNIRREKGFYQEGTTLLVKQQIRMFHPMLP